MAINKDYFEKLLKIIGYRLQDGPNKIYEKVYRQHNDYIIKINFDNEIINYETGNKKNDIIVSNATTSNFSQPENMVVLECVDRLLSQGYKPNSIELEHAWPSGHGTSGRLDIMVKKDDKSYLMIECKTFGKEFDKEKNNTLITKKVGNEEQPKGQIFSYCFQEKTTEYLCLYASRILDNVVKFENVIIPVEDDWKSLTNQKELYDYWNKSFKKNGIFEENIKPYNIECKALLRSDLDKITNADSSRIFNQFLEILRHNAVSDKPNAFNKILNLFICKIIDEEKADNEELQFQWKDNSTYISLQSNLEELYKQGMDRFLDIEVTDYSDSEIEKNLVLMDDSSKTVIRKMFQELRLQKNPEFAFKEVYNKESFEENAKVLKEVVELLQPFQFRYGHKQQFLGNFFEQLLNTSIKQESGQFFTPIPISRFMISSLPIKEALDKNIANNSKYILPVAIDYACGSGHFLTEYMDILQGIINNYDTSSLGKSLKNKIEKWKQTDNENETQGEFEWAKDCVYGIEKDYRLVKTSKISTFLNGDGEANIIHADGLDKFTSDKYKGLLASAGKSNNNFDFIIANPPYSVSSFKQTLNCDSDDLETFDLLTENSSEIECLFVERTNQLLKEGGCAAIILPSSILSNTGLIYEKTRDILLKNFYIRAIAKMGANTFMATGTNTVILFLEKRPEIHNKQIEKLINDFINTKVDFSYNGTLKVVNNYVNQCFEGLSYKDYISFLKNISTETLKSNIYYIEFIKTFNNSKELKNLKSKKAFKQLKSIEQEKEINDLLLNMILSSEKKKLLYYLLTFQSKTLIIKTGEKQEEKEFLGYEFSNRRGNEGIHYYSDENGNINSSLYDDGDLFGNNEKVNYYIINSFNNRDILLPEMMCKNISMIHTNMLLPFDYFTNNTLSLSTKVEPIETKYTYKKLGDFIDGKLFINGYAFKSENFSNQKIDKTYLPVLKIGNIQNGEVEFIGDNQYHSAEGLDNKIAHKGDFAICLTGATVGKSGWVNEDCLVNQRVLVIKNNELIDYISIILSERNFYEYSQSLAHGNAQGNISPEEIKEYKIPNPDLNIQDEFVCKYNETRKSIENNERNIQSNYENISNDIEVLKSIHASKVLSMFNCIFNPSKKELDSIKLKDNDLVSFVEMANLNTKGYITKSIDKKYKAVKKGYTYFAEDDIIIAKITPCMENGKCALAKNLTNNVGFGSSEYHVIRTDKTQILPEFLFYILNRQEIRDMAKEEMTGKSGHRRVPEDFYKNILIPVLNIGEQEKFIMKLDGYKNQIRELEKEIVYLKEQQREIFKKYL